MSRFCGSSITHYLQLLNQCIESKSINVGHLIHQCLLKLEGVDFNAVSPVVYNLIRLYINCKQPKLAEGVLNFIPSEERKSKSILWNQIIGAYAWDGPFESAIDLYNKMVVTGAETTKYTYPYVLKACSALQDLETGRKIHAQVKKVNLENDTFVSTALIDCYSKSGGLVEAKMLFDEMHERDVVSWNTMISGFSLHGMGGEAIELVLEMQRVGEKVNSSTMVSLLQAVALEGRLPEGKAIHGFCLRKFFLDTVLATSLLDMYGKCGNLVYAMNVFDAIPLKNEITWSNMLEVCVSCSSIVESFNLFCTMRMAIDGSPSPLVLQTLIRGSAKLNDLNTGMQLHCYSTKLGFDVDLMVTNTMLSMYAKCGSLTDAMRLLQKMQFVNSVSYSAIISGCIQNGCAEEAFKIFHKMQLRGLKPEKATMMGFLPACSYLAALQHGLCGHAFCLVHGFTSDLSICNALIDMYTKCGKTHSAWLVFSSMSKKDVVSWNTMIAGFGINGLGRDAILLFETMQNSGCKPDELTFIALLSACSHSGLLTEGKHFFDIMSEEFSIVPTMDHYFCMVDLLGRTGLLSEAHHFIVSMPFDPNSHIWNALLAACRIHKNVELAEEVSLKIQALGPASTGNFVLLFNLYTTAHRWKDAANVRILQRQLGFKKKPGCSWIEVNGIVHAFIGGDRSHPRSSEIYIELEKLASEMKKLGYTAESDFVYQDVEEEEKESILLQHSEKLAVAFGIMSLQGDKTILVTKNLRVCGDCHTALKYITVIAKRDISVRDTVRFHHFKDGACSCGDFW